MRAFISYSLNDSEQYVVTILAKKLQERGISVTASHIMATAFKADLFIGIITSTGNANRRVIDECRAATRNQIPLIILVEDNTLVQELQGYTNVIRFNRHNPQPAIEMVNRKIVTSTNSINEGKNQNNSDSAAWVFGGIAILALIALLSGKDK